MAGGPEARRASTASICDLDLLATSSQEPKALEETGTSQRRSLRIIARREKSISTEEWSDRLLYVSGPNRYDSLLEKRWEDYLPRKVGFPNPRVWLDCHHANGRFVFRGIRGTPQISQKRSALFFYKESLLMLYFGNIDK